MKKRILLLALRIAKLLGLFSLARRVTAHDLRILCYHGAALSDEHRFSPGLFMTERTFAERMAYLAREGYSVVTLDAAYEGLQGAGWCRGATVITIDDGWYGTYKIMGPILKRYGFPATLYLCSYYVTRPLQVFNVALNYVLWKAGTRQLDLSAVAGGLSGAFDLANEAKRDEAYRRLIDFSNTLPGAQERQELLRKVCACLGVDCQIMEKDRICRFVNAEEARMLLDMGVDLQLHTHRHRFGVGTYEQASIEINDNRRVVRSITESRPLRHFCYPSGLFSEEQTKWLPQLGVATATTTQGGFNRTNTSPYALRRFLDSERVSMLEFEAEMSGFFELIRRCGYAI